VNITRFIPRSNCKKMVMYGGGKHIKNASAKATARQGERAFTKSVSQNAEG
jgi:hypothetical protein